jgi:hypothetical protein
MPETNSDTEGFTGITGTNAPNSSTSISVISSDGVLINTAGNSNTSTLTSNSNTSTSTSNRTTSIASNATGPASPATEDTANGTSLSSGAKIGIGVAVPVCVIFIAIILAVFITRHRRRKRLEKRQNGESRPNESHGVGFLDDQESSEYYHQKPELAADPVLDLTFRGPVKPKAELHGQGIRNRQLSSHDPGGHMPPEMHPDTLVEAGTDTLTRQLIQQLKQDAGNSQTSASKSTAVPSFSDQSQLNPLQATPAESTELAEEADVIVQELGLVNLRKKALATQAGAMKTAPEDVPGRKGEEFRELLGRETRLKGRLDEIERHNMGHE